MPKGATQPTIYILLALIIFFASLKLQTHQIQASILNSPVLKQLIGFNLPLADHLLPIPLLTQERNLSCESAAIRMVLTYLGQDVPEAVIQSKFPLQPNPHKGFRGNVDGPIWGFKDYGAYSEAVADVMHKFNVQATSYNQISEDFLKNRVLLGKPAIIWVDVANPNPQVLNLKIATDSVKLVSGEHTVVVKGYKDGQWIINDPWRRTATDGAKISEELHVKSLNDIRWDQFDHMAVIVD